MNETGDTVSERFAGHTGCEHTPWLSVYYCYGRESGAKPLPEPIDVILRHMNEPTGLNAIIEK